MRVYAYLYLMARIPPTPIIIDPNTNPIQVGQAVPETGTPDSVAGVVSLGTSVGLGDGVDVLVGEIVGKVAGASVGSMVGTRVADGVATKAGTVLSPAA